MARPLKKRVFYTNDAIKFRQVQDALRLDDTRPEKWREDTIKAIQEVITRLLSAPPPEDMK